MSAKIHVLIVDDEPINLELMEEILSDSYHVDCVSSGAECLSFLQENNPDLVLLDVAMPYMDGYQVCTKIKADVERILPVIFVSARGSLEDRLAGYEAGGDDYLVKPFNNQELLAKVHSMVNFVNKQGELTSQMESANDLTMMVMTSSGEIGLVLNFLRQTFDCQTLDSLAKVVFETLAQLGLKSTVRFKGDNAQFKIFSSDGTYKPVEAELLELAHNKGRIFNYNQRSIFNFSDASLLIKDMPTEEESDDLRGRFLDHLCILMEGVNARVIALIKEQKIAQHALRNKSLLVNTKQGMLTIQETLQQQKRKAIDISQNLIYQLERDLLSLGLDEDQEKYLVHLVEKNMNELTKLFDKQEVIDDFFNETIAALE